MQVKIGERTVGDAEVVKHLRITGDWEEHAREACRLEVLCALAQAREVSVSDAELQQAVDIYRKIRGLHKADETRLWLERMRLSLDDLERNREALLLQQKLMQALPAEEVEQAFTARRSGLDRARVSLIVCREEAKARELKEQISEDDADFGQLALAHSEDESAARMGQLGWVQRGSLPDEAAARVFAAEPGEVIGPLLARGRYALYQVHELASAELTPELELELREALVQQACLQLYRDQLATA